VVDGGEGKYTAGKYREENVGRTKAESWTKSTTVKLSKGMQSSWTLALVLMLTVFASMEGTYFWISVV